MTEAIAIESSVTAEVNEVKKTVETINAKAFRQEWEEICKMRVEDLRPTTREEKAVSLALREEQTKMIEKWRQELKEKEKQIFRTPLSRAVWDSNLGLVQNLVKQQGIDINQSDGDDQTPLGAAISKATGDNFEIVRLLVDAGADVNKVTVNQNTPICSACHKAGNLELIQFMVEHGADTKGTLSAAAISGDMAIVQVLNTTNAYGFSYVPHDCMIIPSFTNIPLFSTYSTWWNWVVWTLTMMAVPLVHSIGQLFIVISNSFVFLSSKEQS